MIEQIQELQGPLPFSYEQRGSVIISSSPIVIDLLFMEEINALVIKDFRAFEQGFTPTRTQSFCDLKEGDDHLVLKEFGLRDDFIKIILSMTNELETTALGVQITSPQKDMCPSFHVDKLPLRIAQCFNADGPTLKTESGEVITTEVNDLVFLKGELWQSNVGGIVHKSPQSLEARRLIRVDFLN